MHHVPIDNHRERDGLSTLLWALLSAVLSCVAASAPQLFGDSHRSTTR